MQKFKDTETGALYQFDDDVIADNSSGQYRFMGPGGEICSVPLSLVPAEPGDAPAPINMVPAAVSRYQGRQALRLSTIEGGRVVINDASDPGTAKRDMLVLVDELLAKPETPTYYREAWADLQQFERDSRMLADLADELGLTRENMDDLFIFAATLKA